MTCGMNGATTLQPEPWKSGWQVRVRARGWLRLFPAAFLGVWLCGWLLGEVFAARMLFGIVAPRFGVELTPSLALGMGGSSPPVAAGITVFLGVWLAFWTFGGLMAMRELLHLIAGEEVVRWNEDGIEALRGVGPFKTTRRVKAEDLKQIRVRAGRVEADTRRGRVVIATFGTREDRQALCAALRRALAAWLEGERRWIRDGEPFRAGLWRETLASGMPALESGWRWFGERLEPGPGKLTRISRIGPVRIARTWEPLILSLTMEPDSEDDEHWILRAEDGVRSELLHLSREDPAPAHAVGEWLTRHTGVSVQERRLELGRRRAA